MTSGQILTGITVLEYGHFVAGPYCARLLADLGAEVIKIEEPGRGDEARRRGPFPQDIPHHEKSGLFLYLNTNKSGVTLNLKNAAGRKIFRELVPKADIFIENSPVGFLHGAGLDYEALREINPRLIMTSISPFGQTGLYRDYKADYMNIYHAGGEGYLLPGGMGWLLYSEREPIRAGGFLGEYDSGLSAACATMGALLQREITGQGQYLDISQQEALLGLMRQEIGRYNTGWIESRATRSFPVAGLFQCKDGFVLLMPFEKHMWDGLMEAVGSPEWAGEERFQFSQIAAAVDVRKHAAQEDRNFVNDFLADWCFKHTKEEIYRLGQEKGCAVAMVSTAEEIVNSPQLAARGFFTELSHPEAGTLQYPGAPHQFSQTPVQIKRPAPLLGEHNEEIYCQHLGYTKEEVVRMKQGGVI